MLIMLCQPMSKVHSKTVLLAWLNFYICSGQHLCICVCIGITTKHTFICQHKAGINILVNTATSRLECRASLMARFGGVVYENYGALTFP